MSGEDVVFMNPNVLQFRCKQCRASVTWSRWRTGGYADCIVDRVNCQDAMMTGRCPHCRKLYARRMQKSLMVPNDELEQNP